MTVLGYMTAKQAKEYGFTHSGSYYGIPIWMGCMDQADGPMIATKWEPMEYLMSLFHHIEGICHAIRGSEPSFMFVVKDEI